MTANHATNPFRWLRSGEEAFAGMLAAIDAARTSVRLEMYIYTASPLGEQFRQALVRAQLRGVRVQVLVDALGSLNLSNSFWEPLTAAGGQFRWFNPITLKRMMYRDHRKILICDEAVAFVGGYNIAPEYQGDGVTRGWLDLGLQVTGPLAWELARSFDATFGLADFRHQRFTRLRKRPVKNRVATVDGDLFLSGPGRGLNPMKRSLLTDLRRASTANIISAYFLPTWRIQWELIKLARLGRAVQLVVAGRSDVPLSLWAGQSLYQSMMRFGIQIYEYQPQNLHAKLFLIDDTVYAGSANLDLRSLNINYELMIRLRNPQAAAEAKQFFAEVLGHCRRIDRDQWSRSRGLWQKLKERWAYFILAKVDPYVARRQLKTLR